MGLSFFELIKDHKIDQIGFLYRDVEKQVEKMEKILGLPKFAINPNAKSKVIYRGKEYEMEAKIAISRGINTQIELIQWLSGKCYHKEYLEKYGEGFYHISVIVDDLNPYFELFKSLNLEVLQERWIGRQHVVYFDTKDALGMVIEMQTTERRKKKS